MKVGMTGLMVVKMMLPEQPDNGGSSWRPFEAEVLGYPVSIDLETNEIEVLTPVGGRTTFAALSEGFPKEEHVLGYGIKRYTVSIDPVR